MTTIVVVRKNGAVALAADTLWKYGSTMLRVGLFANHSKILRVGDSLIASDGSAAWGNVLARYFARLKRPPDLSGVEAIFETVLRMHPVLKRRYGLIPDDEDRDGLGLLVANRHGAFTVSPDRAVLEVAQFCAHGAGYQYALGAMHAAYRSAERPEDIARAGVEAAAEFDEHTGLPVEVFRVELSESASRPNELLQPTGPA
jgi:ATP-dependent protease HslVU (ClpYQ) peptidase subunit